MPKHNGADLLIAVNVSDSSLEEWVAVGGQRGANFNDTTALIDLSDKLTGRLGESIPGRATAEVSMELVFQDEDEGLIFLKAAYRGRDQVKIMRQVRADNNSPFGWIEEAFGTIIDFSEDWPDQDAATVAMTIHMDNDWAPSTS